MNITKHKLLIFILSQTETMLNFLFIITSCCLFGTNMPSESFAHLPITSVSYPSCSATISTFTTITASTFFSFALCPTTFSYVSGSSNFIAYKKVLGISMENFKLNKIYLDVGVRVKQCMILPVGPQTYGFS